MSKTNRLILICAVIAAAIAVFIYVARGTGANGAADLACDAGRQTMIEQMEGPGAVQSCHAVQQGEGWLTTLEVITRNADGHSTVVRYEMLNTHMGNDRWRSENVRRLSP